MTERVVEVLERGLDEGLVCPGPAAGFVEHGRLGVDGDDVAVRDLARHDGGQVPRSAAEVEDTVGRLQRRGGEEARVVGAMVAGVGRVRGAVPRRHPGAAPVVRPGQLASNRMRVLPKEISSPSTSSCSVMRTPLTREPFVLPRSTTT